MAKSAGLGDLLSNIPIVGGLADYGRGTGGLLTKRDNKKMEKSGRIMKTSKFGGKKHYIKKVGREASSPQKAVAASFASSGGHLDGSNNGRLPLVGSLIKISNGDASLLAQWTLLLQLIKW